MTHLEILCYAIAHVDHLKDNLLEKLIRFTGHPDMQTGIDKMIADLDCRKAKLKAMYEIECGSKYEE